MKRTTLKIVAVAVSLSVGAATTVAVRTFFDRPGESALKLVPADANLVIVEDLVPAPSQLHAFAQVESALRQVKGQAAVNPIAVELGEPDLSQAIGPYIGRSLAIALYVKNPLGQKMGSDPRKDADGVGFVSLTDVAAAKAALEKTFTPSGGSYKLKDGRFVRVSDGYLELANKVEYFAKVDAIRDGKAKAISAADSFVRASQFADPTANVTVFVRKTNSDPWSTLTGSVEDDGIRVVFHAGKGSTHIAKVKPLPASVLRMIPSGPYGLFSLAQVSSLAGSTMKQAGGLGSSLGSIFKGDLFVGLYPSETAQTAGIDLLLIVDSTNGATPGTAVKQLISQLEKQMMNGQHVFGKPTMIGNAHVYTLAGQLAGMFRQSTKKPMPGVKSDILLGGKTIAFATVGENAYLCTSMPLLKRAIATAQGNSASIVKDASFKSCAAAVESGSQLMLAFNFDRIVAGIENTVTKDNTGARKVCDAIRVVTNGGASLSLSGGSDPDGSAHGRMFIPLNYSKLAQSISKISSKSNDIH